MSTLRLGYRFCHAQLGKVLSIPADRLCCCRARGMLLSDALVEQRIPFPRKYIPQPRVSSYSCMISRGDYCTLYTCKLIIQPCYIRGEGGGGSGGGDFKGSILLEYASQYNMLAIYNITDWTTYWKHDNILKLTKQSEDTNRQAYSC